MLPKFISRKYLLKNVAVSRISAIRVCVEWCTVCGNKLIELLKARTEKAEFEEEKKKAKRMQRKSNKREHEQDIHKEDKKQKIQEKSGKNCTEFQLKQLLENWVPPPIQGQQTEFDDLHWLSDSRVPKRPKIETSLTSKFSLSPINGVRALPYTRLY